MYTGQVYFFTIHLTYDLMLGAAKLEIIADYFVSSGVKSAVKIADGHFFHLKSDSCLRQLVKYSGIEVFSYHLDSCSQSNLVSMIK